MAILRVKSGSNVGTVYEISRESLLLGRDLDAKIQVADQGVSRRHAEILRVGELCLLKDCGSRNGTFINDEQVNERVDEDIAEGIPAFPNSSPEEQRDFIVLTETSDRSSTTRFRE